MSWIEPISSLAGVHCSKRPALHGDATVVAGALAALGGAQHERALTLLRGGLNSDEPGRPA